MVLLYKKINPMLEINLKTECWYDIDKFYDCRKEWCEKLEECKKIANEYIAKLLNLQTDRCKSELETSQKRW